MNKQRFTLFRRGDVYYYEDTVSRKQASLRTKDKAEALTLLHARNEAARQPYLNLRMVSAAVRTGSKTGVCKMDRDL